MAYFTDEPHYKESQNNGLINSRKSPSTIRTPADQPSVFNAYNFINMPSLTHDFFLPNAVDAYSVGGQI